MKKHLLITLSGALFSIILSYYLVVSGKEQVTTYTTFMAVLSASAGVIIAYVLSFVTQKLDKIYSWQSKTNQRLFIGLLVQYIIALGLIILLFYSYVVFYDFKEVFFEYYREPLIKLALLVFIIIVVYSIVYFAFYSYYSFATLQIASVKQERKQIDLQLKALKSQLSPHFLFNCLNTISSLVHSDAKKSEKFIRKLSNMYQYTLNSYHSKLISLKEELAFVESYQYLLETRFDQMFCCKIELSEELMDTKIPPLTLQMLIENVVKHNKMEIKNPLNIHVFKEGEYICVRNNITETPQAVSSFQIGLKNINTRYLLLVNKGISISNGHDFMVKIPIIR